MLALLGGCALLRPAPPPPEPGVLLADLERRLASIESLMIEGRGSLRGPEGSQRGDISLAASRRGELRLEAYGPFGQPALFVAVRGGELRAINFSEHRYYVGPAASPRLAAFLPLGLSAEELFALLAAAPVPARPTACRSAPPGQAPALQRAVRGRGTALLVAEGRAPARLLFGEGHLLAASFGAADCELVAVYSDWRAADAASFPRRLEFSLPASGRGLRLDASEVRLNEPLPNEAFQLEPPPGFAVVEVP